MLLLRRYHSPAEADAAAGFLRAHGVMARVNDSVDALGGLAMSAKMSGSFELLIMDSSQRASAESLLARLHLEPVDTDWDFDAKPDLSSLPSSLAPACPACGRTLPLDASCRTCPGCAAPVDVPDLIVRLHGPDALAHCYPKVEDEDLVASALKAPLACPGCDYSLAGLPRLTTCPECGLRIDKVPLFRSLFDDRPPAG